MYNVMKTLITNKYYLAKEDATVKLDVFYAMNKLTDEEYLELTQLAETMYNPPVVEEEPLPEETV